VLNDFYENLLVILGLLDQLALLLSKYLKTLAKSAAAISYYIGSKISITIPHLPMANGRCDKLEAR